MNIDLEKLDELPRFEPSNVVHALRRDGIIGKTGYGDWDLSNQARNCRKNLNARNSKAKWRKKFSRR